MILIPLAAAKVMLTHSLWLFPASIQCQCSGKCLTIHYTVTRKAAIPFSKTAQTIGLQAPKRVAYQILDAFSRGGLPSATKITDGRRRISATGFWGRIQDPLSPTRFFRLEYLTSTSLSNGSKAEAFSTQPSMSWECLGATIQETSCN